MLSRQEMLAPFRAGETPIPSRAIGLEFETLVQDRQTGRTVPYAGPHGIAAILQLFADRFGWEPVLENGNAIALSRGRQSITLEPGGQLELSGAPHTRLADVEAELLDHLDALDVVQRELPVDVHWLGMNPWQSHREIQWVPKGRYEVMKRYLPTRGRMAHYMMGLTCTVQSNLDYTTEADFARKLRVTTGLSPIVTALFANSPRHAGKVTPYQSFRARVWTEVDPDRCGTHRFVFDTDAGYDDYASWVRDVPLFFVVRDGSYVDLAGRATFRDLNEGRVPGLEATLEDWTLHMSTVFPDVRARPYLEMRASDVVPPEAIMSSPALWKGIVYDEDCTDAAWDLTKNLTSGQRVELADSVGRCGLWTRRPDGPGHVLDLARDLVLIASEGLRRQAAAGLGDADDDRHLAPLVEIVESGRSFADRTLKAATEMAA